MIWIGVIIFIIIGIFYSRISFFVEHKSDSEFSVRDIDQMDSLNGYTPASCDEQNRRRDNLYDVPHMPRQDELKSQSR
jgi:hypothetical protein